MRSRATCVLILCVLIGNSVLAKPLRLHLTYYPTIEFAGIYLAQEKGWYKEAGIDLQIMFIDLKISNNLIDGKADIAMHSGHEVIRQVAQHQDLKAFAAEYQINPLSLVTDPSIKNLKSLKGKTIGIFTEQEKDFIRVMFAQEGMTLDQVIFKTIKSFTVDDLMGYLQKKEYDAIPVWAFNHPVGFALKGYSTRQFPSHMFGFNFYGTVFYAKSKTIDERKEELAKFIQVTRRGWIEAYKNPEKTVRNHMKKYYPKNQLIDGNYELTLKQQQTQMKLSRRYLFDGVGEAGFGEMTKVQWLAGVNIAKRDGIISNRDLRPESVYTDDVMKIVRSSPK